MGNRDKAQMRMLRIEELWQRQEQIANKEGCSESKNYGRVEQITNLVVALEAVSELGVEGGLVLFVIVGRSLALPAGDVHSGSLTRLPSHFELRVRELIRLVIFSPPRRRWQQLLLRLRHSFLLLLFRLQIVLITSASLSAGKSGGPFPPVFGCKIFLFRSRTGCVRASAIGLGGLHQGSAHYHNSTFFPKGGPSICGYLQ